MNEGQKAFRLTLLDFSRLKHGDFILSEKDVIVDIVVHLILLFLVPELGVT